MARRRTWRWWVWRGVRAGTAVYLSKGKPWMRYGGKLGWWWHKYPAVWAKPSHEMLREFLGLSRLPPRNTAWLVEVTAPGKSRVMEKLKGGEA